MPRGTRPLSSTAPSPAAATPPKSKGPPPEPRPSASIILLSPTNQVLLLHRVKTSTSFASAHVFPGGNLSDFHDGAVPPPGDPSRHADSPAYRLGAIRETFEESGILLARATDDNADTGDKKLNENEGGEGGPRLLSLPVAERDEARKAIYENRVGFSTWLESAGGVPDTESLLPFTRWITPPGPPKRFTTQMYLYMLPLVTAPETSKGPGSESDSDSVLSAARQREDNEALIPTPDGGAEITAAHFDDAATWLARQDRGEVILFPPQYFLLHMLAQFFTGPASSSSDVTAAREHYRAQREQLRAFLAAVPTSTRTEAAKNHPTSQIPWADKAISPAMLGLRHADRRSILALDKPGGELRNSGRGGHWEHVVLVRFGKTGPSQVEVRDREEVLAEEREAKEREDNKKGKGEGEGEGKEGKVEGSAKL